MAISPSLQQFTRSSGVYRLYVDKSQQTSTPSNTVRLIMGFSKKGPFNTPVFVQDAAYFKSIFGDIDTTLERKGSFFHRTCLTCLTRGPIIALNLLALDDTLDKTEFQSISTSASMTNPSAVEAPVASYFNKDKFWFPDAQTLVTYANDNQSAVNERLLNIANIGRKTLSVITRKSDILGFDVTANEWYGVGNVPEYLNENDYISDYMIDVIVVEGDFSDYSALSIDPIFGAYFDTTGLKKTYVDQFGISRDGLTSFLALDQVNVLGVYTGSLIPGFISKNGENMFIEDVVNLDISKTGLLLGLDQDTINDEPETISGDLIDTVGHTLESEAPATLNFLSYYGSIVADYGYTGSTGIFNLIVAATAGQTAAQGLLYASASITGATGWNTAYGYYDTVRVFGPSYSTTGGERSYFTTAAEFTAFKTAVSTDTTYIKVGVTARSGPTGTVNFSNVTSESADTDLDYVDLKISLTVGAGITGPTTTAYGYYIISGGTGITAGGTATLPIIQSFDQVFVSGGNIYAGVDSDLYQDNLSGIITDGDLVIWNGNVGGTAKAYAEFTRHSTNDFTGSTWSGALAFGSQSPILSQLENYLDINAWVYSGFTGATAIGASSLYVFTTQTGDINESFELWSGATAITHPTNEVWVDNGASGPLGLGGFTGELVKGQYLVMNFGGTSTPTKIDPITGKSRLTRITSVVEISDPTSSDYQKIKIVTNDPIYVRTDGGVSEIERYKTITDFVDHYRFHTLSGYTLRTAQMPNGTADRENEILDVLTDTNIGAALADRDTISYRYIVDSFQGTIEPASKVRLTRLAMNRQSAFAILNMPAVKQFRESTNPLFKDSSTGTFSTQYIPSGGNLALNPSNVFSLPGIADGSNFGGWYGPFLQKRENGRTISVPPAAYVSNLFIDKYNLALPYSIVAGPRRGIVTGDGLVGLEYNFDRTDLNYVEPFGYNAIINQSGLGLVINANQTGQQNIQSALSQIHVRELLIYIQDGIEAILKNYRWEFNTSQVRLEIKTLADNFLTQILSDGGLYSFRNIMDTTNNTSEIIDANIGILDTYIEPVRGLGVLIHRTTILKTGTIATGNFI